MWDRSHKPEMIVDDKPQLGPSGPVVAVAPPAPQTVWWAMTVVLAVIATALVMRLDDAVFSRSVLAQAGGTSVLPMAGARGIYAFSGPLSSKSNGLFMVDVDTGTVWCYELERGRDNETRLRLVAARSWIFDRYLEEFNVASPTPSEVQAMVQRQTSHAANAVNPPVSTAGANATPEPAAGSNGTRRPSEAGDRKDAGGLNKPGEVGKVVLPTGPALPDKEKNK